MPRWTITEYLENKQIQPKVLVVGCGATSENSKMVFGKQGEVRVGMSCSLGSQHQNDFTLDIDPDSGADVTGLDLYTFYKSELGARRQFNKVIFEYPNRGTGHYAFSQSHIAAWIEAADMLLKLHGQILFYSSLDTMIHAKTKMTALGYIVNDVSHDVANSSMRQHSCCIGTKMRLS